MTGSASPADRLFAAPAVSRWIENTTGESIKRFVTTARRMPVVWLSPRLRTQVEPRAWHCKIVVGFVSANYEPRRCEV